MAVDEKNSQSFITPSSLGNPIYCCCSRPGVHRTGDCYTLKLRTCCKPRSCVLLVSFPPRVLYGVTWRFYFSSDYKSFFLSLRRGGKTNRCQLGKRIHIQTWINIKLRFGPIHNNYCNLKFSRKWQLKIHLKLTEKAIGCVKIPLIKQQINSDTEKKIHYFIQFKNISHCWFLIQSDCREIRTFYQGNLMQLSKCTCIE